MISGHDPMGEQARPGKGSRERRVGTPLIVVGFDTSLSSHRALAYAAGAARRLNAELVIVYVVDIAPMASLAPVGGFVPVAAETVPDRDAGQIAAVRALAAESLASAAIPWRFVVRSGDASKELGNVANEFNADTLITGRTHHVLRRVCGSVPARIVRHARCPITVVP